MRTEIPAAAKRQPGMDVAEKQLRTCVHCGFCNATCPTYLLTGNELEGPRGRIYLIKNVLEGKVPVTDKTLAHIDHCLGCLACETTCPSGVGYAQLLEEARPRLEALGRRPLMERLVRATLVHLLPYPRRFRLALRLSALGRWFAPLLPSRFRQLLDMAPARLPSPARLARPGVIAAVGKRRLRVTLLTGCAQQVLGPQINDASVRLLTRLGAEVAILPQMGCCGALTFHMGERKRSLELMRRAVHLWHQQLEAGVDWIVLNTSGCATAVSQYGHILRDDPQWADKAAAVAAKMRDVCQVVDELGLVVQTKTGLKVAYHDACSLQHGLGLKEGPRRLLRQAGFTVEEVPEGHICCGSAGTYNLLHPHLAGQLRQRKIEHIQQTSAQVVAAGNIGCLEQLAVGLALPVVHTVELLDWAAGGPPPAVLARA